MVWSVGPYSPHVIFFSAKICLNFSGTSERDGRCLSDVVYHQDLLVTGSLSSKYNLDIRQGHIFRMKRRTRYLRIRIP
jgi:hypothetical protein